MEINEEIVNHLGTGEPSNFSSRNKTKKENHLLTLTVSREKSCLIRKKNR